MSTEQMRQDFETWWLKKEEFLPEQGRVLFKRYAGGAYKTTSVAEDWECWKEAIRSVVVQLPDTIGVYAHPESDREWVLDPDDVRAAIEAAGLKVKP